MATPLPRTAASPADELRRLRAQLDRTQAPRVEAPPLPVHPLLASLLPEGGLRPGASYAVSASPSPSVSATQTKSITKTTSYEIGTVGGVKTIRKNSEYAVVATFIDFDPKNAGPRQVIVDGHLAVKLKGRIYTRIND